MSAAVVPWAAFCELRAEVEQLRADLLAEHEARRGLENALLRRGFIEGPPVRESARAQPVGSCAAHPAAETQRGEGSGVNAMLRELARAHDEYLSEVSAEVSAEVAAGMAAAGAGPATVEQPGVAGPSQGGRGGAGAVSDDDSYWSHPDWGADTLAP